MAEYQLTKDPRLQIKPRLFRSTVRVGFFVSPGWACVGGGYQGAGTSPKEAYESWVRAPHRQRMIAFAEGLFGGKNG